MVVLFVRIVRSAQAVDHYHSILRELRARHGFVVPGAALRSTLGFKTTYGWIRALKEGRVGAARSILRVGEGALRCLRTSPAFYRSLRQGQRRVPNANRVRCLRHDL